MLYDILDYDKDGVVSYQDLQIIIGYEFYTLEQLAHEDYEMFKLNQKCKFKDCKNKSKSNLDTLCEKHYKDYQ